MKLVQKARGMLYEIQPTNGDTPFVEVISTYETVRHGTLEKIILYAPQWCYDRNIEEFYRKETAVSHIKCGNYLIIIFWGDPAYPDEVAIYRCY